MADLLWHRRYINSSDEPDKQASLVSVLQLGLGKKKTKPALFCRRQQVRISELLFLTLFILNCKSQFFTKRFAINIFSSRLFLQEKMCREQKGKCPLNPWSSVVFSVDPVQSVFTTKYLFILSLFSVSYPHFLPFHVFQSFHPLSSVMSNQNSAAGKYL